MPTGSSKQLIIDIAIFNERGDSDLRELPYNLTWYLSLPKEKEVEPILKNIKKLIRRVPKSVGLLRDQTHLYPKNTLTHFDLFFNNGKELMGFAEKVFENINLKNIYCKDVNCRPQMFSLKELKKLIAQKELG